ncbi:protein-tyrosine phosphatase-like protein [Glomus cerebriforme]|uniref:Protein-tyrosine phosphatase-like protein n=1 Tax=Glomus cerebriforme TaxID=658196 RepID=A0A397TI39_9GLOM|nr:protein-tyrosine phosphatase-like protein [Glomus cerebriforme]
MSEERVIMPIFLSNSSNLNENALSIKFQLLNQTGEIRCRQAVYNPNDPFNMSVAINATSMNCNRYRDILPFNHNRVKLIQQRPNKTDYINASHIKAPNDVRSYIATQGPLNETIEDFWLMVWEQNTYVIVMLTKQNEKGEIKCETYWPENVGYYMIFEDIGLKVTLESEVLDEKSNCYIRTLKLEKVEGLTMECRQITQLQTLAWPDHGLPNSPDPIINLIVKKNEFVQHYTRLNVNGNIGPIVVHCSAGCGRTGTFCTIDSTLALLPNLQQSDPTDLIFNVIQHFRQQRIAMEYQFSPKYSPYPSQNPTNQDQRSPSSSLSDLPSSSFPRTHDDSSSQSSSQPILASGSRGKKRAWTKEEDQALLDSIIVELSGHWSSICSRNELLIQRGPSMVSQRFKTSIKNKLLGSGGKK